MIWKCWKEPYFCLRRYHICSFYKKCTREWHILKININLIYKVGRNSSNQLLTVILWRLKIYIVRTKIVKSNTVLHTFYTDFDVTCFKWLLSCQSRRLWHECEKQNYSISNEKSRGFHLIKVIHTDLNLIKRFSHVMIPMMKRLNKRECSHWWS